MLPPVELQRDLVLVGGGHAHVMVLRMLAMRPIAGLRITLISPDSHTPYSGMLPGLIAGHYSFEQSHIDLPRLCQWAGVRFIQDEVTGLDAQARSLCLHARPAVNYDVVSLDIGSQPEFESVPGAASHATPVKPVAQFWRRWCALRSRLHAAPAGSAHQIAVVGGGAGSVELILAMAHKLQPEAVSLTLWTGADCILPNYNRRARRTVYAALAELGIEVCEGRRVISVAADELSLEGGSRAPFDELFWCTGASAVPWVASSGLATDAGGFLLLRDTLQSLTDDAVFGAGDIASQQRYPRPKAGVYAVRQGPVLAANLRRYLLAKPLHRHRPQRDYLSLLSLGGKYATAARGPFSLTGAWVWRWKNRIDRKFIARFQQLPANMPKTYPASLPELTGDRGQSYCGGCGAKVGAASLTRVLAGLRRDYPEHCSDPLVSDDAAIIPGTTGLPIVQSIDILRQLVADPWLMGRIAANHALSDLYACGASPCSALASVTLPFANPEIQARDLSQLLAGALHEFRAVDCLLSGGHSLQGSELSLGFVVNGTPLSADGRLLSKRGMRTGDHLLLTKPLGTGTLFAAAMQLRADGRELETAVTMMLQSNLRAVKIALDYDLSAATDVTGFGLLGHLLEMLEPTQGAVLEPDCLPALPGALTSLAAGIRSTGHLNNASLATTELAANLPADPRVDLMFDPQTSGGLLLAVAPQHSGELKDALVAAGYKQARVVGEVTLRGNNKPVCLRS